MYWDTSALVKLYAPEPDSSSFLALAGRAQEIFSASVVSAEVLCALYRKEQAGNLRRGGAQTAFEKFRADTRSGRIVTVPYGSDVVEEVRKLIRLAFEQPRPVLIRSLDAIHVASAAVVKEKVLVATDSRLRALAALAGLTLLP